ncbi:N4-gp56 family major capsid protein [Acinetobacter sp. ANC 5045]|uniref:N4-gp56 family major capsid protein n=1 Tax=Acinetobacter sp. ANC 5045 TaxID=2529851 RepID=UPI00103D2FC4|nr:N4-gp56 family major capsid protein [Acinetobacter sp. ANC 5045]TCB14477.1 N4-gp56 family major capsid protein [Acinetobacter sp. ANC 5045]
MASTNIPFGSPLAKKHFGGAMFNSTIAKSWVAKNLIENAHRTDKGAEMANAPIVVMNDLTKSEGDTVSFDIYMQLTGRGTFGDDNLEGNLESLDSYTDEISINQVRKGVDVGGRMTNKRTVNDQRAVARLKLTEWFSQFLDQTCFTNLAGKRGINPFVLAKNVNYAVKDTHEFEDYDADHIVYGGAATSKQSLTDQDTMTLSLIDKLIVKATTEGGDADKKVRLTPLDKNGEDAYIMLLHPYQEHDLRTNTGTSEWLDIQKAAAGAEGMKSPIFKQNLGNYRGVHFKKHKHVVLDDTYGVSGNVQSARASFMGRQALVLAFGNASSANLRADWTEKKTDVDDNKQAISGRMMFNAKRPRFNGQDVNSYAVDTAAKKPA